MTEHKICKDCKWNEYPLCKGTIMPNGEYMNIENIKPIFKCGQKEELELNDMSIERKSDLDLKIEELETRINELEKVEEVKN